MYLTALGHAYAVAGRKAEAQKALDELTELSRRRYVDSNEIAMVYVGLGENNQALALLQAAFNEHSSQLGWLKVDPRLDPLHSDSRFQDLVRRVGLPQ